MQSYKGRFEPTRFEDLTVTVDFHCHSACRFCIVQEGMNRYRGVPWALYARAVDDNRQQRRYRRVTFTGGEVTLEPRLFEYIDYARRSGSFEHIRLQTNGRRLADPAFARRLVDAGVDEYFVSLHGHDAATQDHISQRTGSFDEAIAGLRNLQDLRDEAEHDVCLMTNTVLTTLNVPTLAALVDTVRPFSPTRMEWWNYLPMEDYADERGLLAPMETLVPSLRAALSRARDYGIETAVKYVPRCLLGEHAACQDNTQPDVVIVEEFYDKYPKFACLYEAKCEHSEACLGLHHPYISKFGWEQDRLRPYSRTTPWHEPEYGPRVGSDRPGQGSAEIIEPSRWTALVEGVAPRHRAALEEVVVQRRACVFRFSLADPDADPNADQGTDLGTSPGATPGATPDADQGTDLTIDPGRIASVDIVLEARDDRKPALVRSRSFNLYYRNIRNLRQTLDAKAKLSALVEDAVRTVVERDPGGMLLDRRKGLTGPQALRRPPRSRSTPAPEPTTHEPDHEPDPEPTTTGSG